LIVRQLNSSSFNIYLIDQVTSAQFVCNSTLGWLYDILTHLHSTLVWLFKSRQLSLSALNTDLTIHVMQAQLILSQHWFNCSSDINHVKLVPNGTTQLNLLWSHSSYVCPDSRCLVQATNVSESASQFVSQYF